MSSQITTQSPAKASPNVINKDATSLSNNNCTNQLITIEPIASSDNEQEVDQPGKQSQMKRNELSLNELAKKDNDLQPNNQDKIGTEMSQKMVSQNQDPYAPSGIAQTQPQTTLQQNNSLQEKLAKQITNQDSEQKTGTDPKDQNLVQPQQIAVFESQTFSPTSNKFPLEGRNSKMSNQQETLNASSAVKNSLNLNERQMESITPQIETSLTKNIVSPLTTSGVLRRKPSQKSSKLSNRSSSKNQNCNQGGSARKSRSVSKNSAKNEINDPQEKSSQETKGIKLMKIELMEEDLHKNTATLEPGELTTTTNCHPQQDESPSHLQRMLQMQNILATDEDESGEESGFESEGRADQQQIFSSDNDPQSPLNRSSSEGKLMEQNLDDAQQDSYRNSKKGDLDVKSSKSPINQKSSTKNLENSTVVNKDSNNEKEDEIEKTEKATLQEEELEQRKLAAGGHKFGSQYFKLNNSHLLEQYNPLKKFYANQNLGKNGGNDKKEAKADKQKEMVTQIQNQLKQVKAEEPKPDPEIAKQLKQEAKQTNTGNIPQISSASPTKPPLPSSASKIANTTTDKSQANQGVSPQKDANLIEQKPESTVQKQTTVKKVTNRFRHPKLLINCYYTKYSIVRKVARGDFKMRVVEEDIDDFDILWCDHCLPIERIMRMKAFQRTNHFPGMQALTRKNSLGKNLNQLRQLMPEEFDFYPRTWLLPTDLRKLKADWKLWVENDKRGEEQTKVMIVKPEASSQGKGIYLTREIEEIDVDDHCVVQEYIDKPFLMDRMKFDLRLYVLVLGIDPLRIYLSKEGLARLSTKNYEQVDDQNLDDMTMHLTNYAINKHSNKFVPNRAAILDSVGHKRSLQFTLKYLERCEGQDSKKLMVQIKDIIVKTLISGQPIVAETFKSAQLDDFENSMCFEILGFDIMLDANCKPYLLEVNHSPSFSTDSPLDEKIKGELIRDTIRLLGMTKKRKAMYKRNLQSHLDHRILSGKFLRLPPNLKEQYKKEFEQLRDQFEPQNLGQFEQLFPCRSADPTQHEQYEKILKTSRKLYMQSNPRYGAKTAKNKQDQSSKKSGNFANSKSLSPNKRERNTVKASQQPTQQTLQQQQVQQQSNQAQQLQMQTGTGLNTQNQFILNPIGNGGQHFSVDQNSLQTPQKGLGHNGPNNPAVFRRLTGTETHHQQNASQFQQLYQNGTNYRKGSQKSTSMALQNHQMIPNFDQNTQHFIDLQQAAQMQSISGGSFQHVIGGNLASGVKQSRQAIGNNNGKPFDQNQVMNSFSQVMSAQQQHQQNQMARTQGPKNGVQKMHFKQNQMTGANFAELSSMIGIQQQTLHRSPSPRGRKHQQPHFNQLALNQNSLNGPPMQTISQGGMMVSSGTTGSQAPHTSTFQNRNQKAKALKTTDSQQYHQQQQAQQALVQAQAQAQNSSQSQSQVTKSVQQIPGQKFQYTSNGQQLAGAGTTQQPFLQVDASNFEAQIGGESPKNSQNFVSQNQQQMASARRFDSRGGVVQNMHQQVGNNLSLDNFSVQLLNGMGAAADITSQNYANTQNNFDQETIARMNEIQNQIHEMPCSVQEKNQLLHLYRMGILTNKSSTKAAIMTMQGGGSGGASQSVSGKNSLVINQGLPGVLNRGTLFESRQIPLNQTGLTSQTNSISLQSNTTTSQQHYHQKTISGGNGMQQNPNLTHQNHESRAQYTNQIKREAYNFIMQKGTNSAASNTNNTGIVMQNPTTSQQTIPSTTISADNKLRRNQSKQYYPMIISTSNNNNTKAAVSGANKQPGLSAEPSVQEMRHISQQIQKLQMSQDQTVIHASQEDQISTSGKVYQNVGTTNGTIANGLGGHPTAVSGSASNKNLRDSNGQKPSAQLSQQSGINSQQIIGVSGGSRKLTSATSYAQQNLELQNGENGEKLKSIDNVADLTVINPLGKQFQQKDTSVPGGIDNVGNFTTQHVNNLERVGGKVIRNSLQLSSKTPKSQLERQHPTTDIYSNQMQEEVVQFGSDFGKIEGTFANLVSKTQQAQMQPYANSTKVKNEANFYRQLSSNERHRSLLSPKSRQSGIQKAENQQQMSNMKVSEKSQIQYNLLSSQMTQSLQAQQQKSQFGGKSGQISLNPSQLNSRHRISTLKQVQSQNNTTAGKQGGKTLPSQQPQQQAVGQQQTSQNQQDITSQQHYFQQQAAQQIASQSGQQYKGARSIGAGGQVPIGGPEIRAESANQNQSGRHVNQTSKSVQKPHHKQMQGQQQIGANWQAAYRGATATSITGGPQYGGQDSSSRGHRTAQIMNKQGQNSASSKNNPDGGFLRPKILDFQPKTGQVDPLLANRARKRGVYAAGHHNNHNQHHNHQHNSGTNSSQGSGNTNVHLRFANGSGAYSGNSATNQGQGSNHNQIHRQQ